MGKESFVPLLMPHHYNVFGTRVYLARMDMKSFEEMASEHADRLLAERSGDYLFLNDPTARKKFINASVYVMRQVEGDGSYDNRTVLLTPEYYIGADGKQHKRVDWFCENACGNYYMDTDGVRKCKAEEKRKSRT